MARSLETEAAAPPPAARVSGFGLFLLVSLTLTWGVNWPLMKLALLEIPPWTFRSLCLSLGGATLLLLTRLAGQRVGFPLRRLPAMALTALFNITGWHLCSAFALLHTGSGRAAIIGYTMPLWVALLSALWLGVRPSTRQLLALGLGMAALALLIGQDLRMLGTAPIGALLMALAALSWAIGTVLVKKLAWQEMSVLALTGWQQLLGVLPILVGWWLFEPVPDLAGLSGPAAFGLFYTIFVAMVFCHTAYFKLVAILPAHVAAIGTLAVPVVGVISAALLLAEPVGWSELVALLLVVSGLFLLIGRPRSA